jgi:zinc transporter, ZIP family
VASSSLLIGGLVALNLPLSRRVIGLVMAFGAGVLVSALAYELFLEATETADRSRFAAGGLFAGSLTFFIGDALIDRMGGDERKSMKGTQASGVALAIVLGIVLDGIPESAVIGVDLRAGEGVGWAFIVAVFLSNLPEAAGASTGLAAAGWRTGRIYLLWIGVALVSGVAAALGWAVVGGAGPDATAFILAFAAGAILTMLADTMFPEAFEQGGKAAGLLTTLGFAVAFTISTFE